MASFIGDVAISRNLTARSSREAVLEVTANTTLTSTSEGTIVVGAASSAVTITLPAVNATNIGIGKVYEIVNRDNANVSVVDSGSTSVGSIPAGESVRVLAVTSASPGTWDFALIGATVTTINPFVDSFNATSDSGNWSAASGGLYTITVAVGTHNKGTTPQVEVYQSSDNQQVFPNQVIVATNGDVSINVPETPDLRFAGRIVIGGA